MADHRGPKSSQNLEIQKMKHCIGLLVDAIDLAAHGFEDCVDVPLAAFKLL
jgi:hypothetical protein